MTKLYRKSEIAFAILWIVAYVVLSSLADQLSESVGIVKSATAALHIAMSLILFFWIAKNGLAVKYGLCRPNSPQNAFCSIFRWRSSRPRLYGMGSVRGSAFRGRCFM